MDHADPPPRPPSPPGATYRLQLNAGFDLDAAAAQSAYLTALGVTHVYASPFLAARAGSPHGYDITDHNAINPELGGRAAFERFHESLRRHGMGLILDFVPNHMGVGRADNRWWLDVLEWGRLSPYARYFDIDWEPAKPELRGKVLLPFLGAHYGEVLERGELRLALDGAEGTFAIHYHEHRFPIGPRHYARILGAALAELPEAGAEASRAALEGLTTAFRAVPGGNVSLRARAAVRARAEELKGALARLVAEDAAATAAIARAVEAFNGRPEEPRSLIPLHRLLEAQSYRLSFWRVAADEINYRRFFDINELAGLRVELPELFDLMHRLVLELIAEGKLHGLRIDHVDGLFDPQGYCEKLAARALLPGPRDEPAPGAYLVVEKILAQHEFLPPSWPVHGTTGYEFAWQAGGLFVDPAGERALDRLYRRFVASDRGFDEVVRASKIHVMEHLLASELQVLANALDRIAERDWRTRDLTLNTLREALKETVTCFPVYRTYVNATGAGPQDRRDIDWATSQARKRSALPAEVFEFLHGVLTTDLARGRPRGGLRRRVVEFAMKFQQFTSPVAAKGVEDTALYRYTRLVALNEVGGDPRRFGVSPAAFHHLNQERARQWPHTMLATSTHDAKRGEDVRARLFVLSEIPGEWGQRVRRWARLNRRAKTLVDDEPAPSANDEFLLYQTLLGSWPLELADTDALDRDSMRAYCERVQDYMTKAAREAKTNSSWASPNEAYEAAGRQFIERILEPGRSVAFLSDFLAFQARVAELGMVNGLSQTLLKLAAPGVPDLYQGTELWDLRLVDPDNRRPVDFQVRHRTLRDLDAAFREAGEERTAAELEVMLANWRDGRVKMYVVWRLLALRRAVPALFAGGDYLALEVEGERAEHVCAFARRHEAAFALFAAPRLVAGLSREARGLPLGAACWGDTRIVMPEGWPGGSLRNVLTGERIAPEAGNGREAIPAATLFRRFPVAAAAHP